MKYSTLWTQPTIKQIRYNAALRKKISDSGISLSENELNAVRHIPNTKYQYTINIQELLNILDCHNISVKKKKPKTKDVQKKDDSLKEETKTAPIMYPTYRVLSRSHISLQWNRTYNKRFYSF